MVPSIGLGTLTWGRDTPAEDAEAQVEALLDAGGSVIDSSPYFGGGVAQAVLGGILAEKVARSDLHIISRVGLSGDGVDASRANIQSTLRQTLEVLETDWIDTLVLAQPDTATQMEETADALARLVHEGRVHQIGLGNCPGWYGALMSAYLADRGVKLAAFHMEYSLLNRGIEREILPLADAIGAGLFAWSPLGRGVLAGRYRHNIPPNSRAASPHLAGFVEPYLGESSRRIVEATATAAEGLGCDITSVALAWTLASGADCVLVGPRTSAQLSAILSGLDDEVPIAVIEALTDITQPSIGYPELF